jgi:hypothetical protein
MRHGQRTQPVVCETVAYAMPELIVELRRHVGYASLWSAGVTLWIRGRQVLFVKRSNNQAWTVRQRLCRTGRERG